MKTCPDCRREHSRGPHRCSRCSERKRRGLDHLVGNVDGRARPPKPPCPCGKPGKSRYKGEGPWLCSRCRQRAVTHGDYRVTLRPTYGQGIVKDCGYKYLFMPGHPLAHADGYVAEHRLVVHSAGVVIPAGSHVHHINEDKLDNRLENLEVLAHGEHQRRHLAERGYVRNQFGTWPLRRSTDAA